MFQTGLEHAIGMRLVLRLDECVAAGVRVCPPGQDSRHQSVNIEARSSDPFGIVFAGELHRCGVGGLAGHPAGGDPGDGRGVHDALAFGHREVHFGQHLQGVYEVGEPVDTASQRSAGPGLQEASPRTSA